MTITHQKALDPKAQNKLSTAIDLAIKNILYETHTATIGIVQEFDSGTQRVTVQPAIRFLEYTEDKKTYTLTDTDYPLLVNVPVLIPSGGGYFFTSPIKRGDTCLLIFNERSISNWKRSGGVQDQSHRGRAYSMEDAIAIVGLRSLSDPLENYNADYPEIRNLDGSIKFEMVNNGARMTGNLEILGNLSVQANNDIGAEGNITSANNISTATGEVSAGSVNLSNHTHGPGSFSNSAGNVAGVSGGPV